MLLQRVFLWGFHPWQVPPVRASPAVHPFLADAAGTGQRTKREKQHSQLQRGRHGAEELRVCSARRPTAP